MTDIVLYDTTKEPERFVIRAKLCGEIIEINQWDVEKRQVVWLTKKELEIIYKEAQNELPGKRV